MNERYGQTEIHPLALALTLAMGVAMLFVRRDRAVIPLLVVACFITHAQRVVVAGLDFSMLRIIIVFGWMRLLYRGEMSSYRFHRLDGLLLVWLTLANLAYAFGPRASVSAFVLRLGLTLDAMGIYFLFRILLRDVRDVQRGLVALGLIAVAVAGPMVVENLTGRNLFSALGGVAEITWIRDGRLRCQGSFSHPIMAGNFGATSAALLIGLVMAQKQRGVVILALASAVTITLLSASSGPLMALVGALLAWSLWPLRRNMRVILWATSVCLVIIHFAREKPIWHLIGRVGKITGGTGWHRYRLIDEFFAHFDEWWFLGADTTAHWEIPQALDVTNQYVIEGLRGGLPTLLAFIAILVVGFRTVGGATRRATSSRVLSRGERRRGALLCWSLGACLFSHAIAFIGVSYFGQLMSLFYLHLAMIPSMAGAIARAERGQLVRPTTQAPAPAAGDEIGGQAEPSLAALFRTPR